MKLEPWVPSFMRRISKIWHEDQARDRNAVTVSKEPVANPKAVYVYAINMQVTNVGSPPTPVGTIEVKSPKPLPYGRLLRIEDAE